MSKHIRNYQKIPQDKRWREREREREREGEREREKKERRSQPSLLKLFNLLGLVWVFLFTSKSLGGTRVGRYLIRFLGRPDMLLPRLLLRSGLHNFGLGFRFCWSPLLGLSDLIFWCLKWKLPTSLMHVKNRVNPHAQHTQIENMTQKIKIDHAT